jgi:hypothetical protein
MFETYRMLGREREKELEAEAARLRPLAGRPINRISVVIVAVIVAAFAFGATIARAEVWPEGRAGAQLTAQPPAPDLIERWVASHKTHVLAPDDRIRSHRSVSAVGPTDYGPLDPPIAAAILSHRSSSAVGPTDYGPLDPPIAAAIRSHRSGSAVGHKTHALAPDDRIRVRPTEASNQMGPPDLIERWVASHQRQVDQARPASTSQNGEAFDWRAAVIGASTTAGLALALGLAIGIARRSRIGSAAA